MLQKFIAILLLGIFASACHTVRFDISDEPVQNVVHERKSFFLFGLIPDNLDVDVSEHCPSGAARIEEETGFVDGLYTVLFLGLWELRSSYYHCIGEDTAQ